ncbi:MAG: GyrI-like domain-containing protein [Methanobrevibacter sp.]|nr:GyrI-like domain-containing protein [Candidatus Methanoflexus mossambicus]
MANEIIEKVIKEEKMAIINHLGLIEDIDILISQLMGWAEANKIKITGAPFAIYYSMPKNIKTDEIPYDIGVPINSNIEDTDKIKIVELLEHKVLSIVHKGSYDKLKNSYSQMIKYSLENNYDIIGSPKEIYLNNPHVVAEEELLTEIQFPVIKTSS